MSTQATSDATLRWMFENGQAKEAEGKMNDFLRLRSREDGKARAILPPYPVEPRQLTKSLDSDHLQLIKDMEPNSTGAMGIPFGTGVNAAWMGSKRYRIVFSRIGTERYRIDKIHLQTYDMDLKDLFEDLMLKDITDEEDRKFIGRINVMVGQLNQTDPTACERLRLTGARGNVTAGPISRESVTHAANGLVATYNELPTNVRLVNSMTARDIGGKLDRLDWGGDVAEDIMLNGFAQKKLGGINAILTNNRRLVPNNVEYFFAPPKFLGDFAIVEDVTTSFEEKEHWISMRSWETIGITVKNIAGATRVQYTGSREEWNIDDTPSP